MDQDGELWDVRVSWTARALSRPNAALPPPVVGMCVITFVSDDHGTILTTDNWIHSRAGGLTHDDLQELLNRARKPLEPTRSTAA
jgi:hypothetical protein